MSVCICELMYARAHTQMYASACTYIFIHNTYTYTPAYIISIKQYYGGEMVGAENSSLRNIKTWKLKIKITQETSASLLMQTRVHYKMMWLAL